MKFTALGCFLISFIIACNLSPEEYRSDCPKLFLEQCEVDWMWETWEWTIEMDRDDAWPIESGPW